jgi:Domain of unknown function (DUF4267)
MTRRTIKVLAAGGLIGVGAAALVAPRTMATVFGMPTDDPTALAYARAACLRDAVIGGIVLTTPDQPEALKRAVMWAAAIGLLDAVLLAATRGPRWQHALHLGGFVAVALLGLTISGRDE